LVWRGLFSVNIEEGLMDTATPTTGKSALIELLDHSLPSNYFLDGLALPDTLSGVRKLLVRDGQQTAAHVREACSSEYERTCKRIELFFYPCTAEVELTLNIFRSLSYFYRCLAAGRNWVRAINSQVAAFANQKLEVLPRPAHAPPCLHLVDYSAGMDGASFVRRLDELLGKGISREPIPGMPLLSQISLLPVTFASRPNIKAFADRLYYALDAKIHSHHLMPNPRTAFAKRHPEIYIQFLLQVYNVGALLVYVPEGENFNVDVGRRFLLFLAETTETTGVPVFLLGPPIVSKTAAALPSLVQVLLSNMTRVHRYSNSDGCKLAERYVGELGADIAELLDRNAITLLPENAAYQRAIIHSAINYAIGEACARLDNVGRLAEYINAYIAAQNELIGAIDFVRKHKGTNESDLTNYSQYLPWDVKVSTEARKPQFKQ
jgi:hypothetical protein